MANNPKQKTRNQHTVPQCYLRGFANAQGNFFSFNKLYRKSKPANVKSSASADYFYDFEPATLQNQTDEIQWVETTFSMLERRFKEVLDAFIDEAKAGEIGHETGSSMAQFVAIQWMRTSGHRETLLELYSKAMQDFVDGWYAKNHPNVPPGKFTMGAGYAEAFHAQSIFENNSIFHFGEMFWNLLWVVGRNRTGKPFYTSDEPVARKNHPVENCSSGPLPPGIGLEYAFPLNSEFILVMMDRRKFRGFKNYERKTMEFAAEDVERYNAMQVMTSTQYVFCEEQDFELAELVCREHSEVCDPERNRCQISFSRQSAN
jgi:hypothetical protein